jgi:hypothetical protein
MMNRMIVAVSALMVAAWLPGAAIAAVEPALDVLDAPVAYSADFVVSSDRGRYSGHVWHMPGKELREFETSGGGQALLILRDSDAAYLMKPAAHWYVGLGLKAVGALAGGLDGWQVDRRRVRDESVNGIRTTRWKAQASGPKGRFDGDLWTSRDGIVVKAAGTVSAPGGEAMPVEMVLSTLKLGGVEATKFDLPKGWLGIDLRQVPPEQVERAMEGLKPMLEGRGGGR